MASDNDLRWKHRLARSNGQYTTTAGVRMIIQDRMKVTGQRSIAKDIFEMKLTGKLVGEIHSPGQFVHIRVADSFEPLLRRPISIASIDKAKE